jgi:deoxycytidine triphosphate deaminase
MEMEKTEKMYVNGSPVGGGAILTRTAIINAIEVEDGDVPEITIEPYDRSCVGPCSYDIHTGTQYAKFQDMEQKRLIGTHWEYWKDDEPDEDDKYWGHWVEVEEWEDYYRTIDPYDPSTYLSDIMDIPAEGLICYPDHVYLIGTKETVGSKFYEPILTAKSSIGRLGVSVAFADFGDIGFKGTWTLQIKTTYPTIIRANMKIGQIYFLTPSQEITEFDLYNGKYQGAQGIRPSEYYKDVDDNG